VKNKRAFGLLQVTNALSGVSNGVVMITVPWIVLEITGSAAKAGLLAALSSLPGIVVAPVVGGLIDRFGRRAISIFSDVMSMLSVLMFLVITWTYALLVNRWERQTQTASEEASDA
jgi:MFS family permease